VQLRVRTPRATPLAIGVHGATSCGASLQALEAQFAIARVDLRGHGRSGSEPPWDVETHVADLLETADALGLERTVWIGVSFGGLIVSTLAARHPDRVSGLVLLDPAIQLPADLMLAQAEEDRTDKIFADATAAVDDRLAQGTLYTTPRSTVEAFAAEHLVPTDGGVRWNFVRSAAIVAWSEMAKTPPPAAPVPTLLVSGERSWLDPGPLAARLEAELAGDFEHLVVPGGHSVLWDDPVATTTAVAAFVSRASA
jgi:lipase